MRDLAALIRDVPDFPKPGILFKDITPLLADPAGLGHTLDLLAEKAARARPDVIAGPESRGFLFGMGLATRLKLGFLPIRKPGKLPWKTRRASYDLEYGTDAVEIHEDAVRPGQRVLLVDDLLATGGTMQACCQLVEGLGGTVAQCLFVIELTFLNGREKLPGRPVESLLRY